MNERLSRMPPRKQAAEVAIDIESEVRKKIETGSKIAPAPDDEEQESVAVDVYRSAMLSIVNARPAPPQKPRVKVLRFSPVLRVCVYDNVATLTHQEWCSSTDIVYNKRLAAALQRKLGGRRRRRWVEGDEARLAQDAGFASIGVGRRRGRAPASTGVAVRVPPEEGARAGGRLGRLDARLCLSLLPRGAIDAAPCAARAGAYRDA